MIPPMIAVPITEEELSALLRYWAAELAEKGARTRYADAEDMKWTGQMAERIAQLVAISFNWDARLKEAAKKEASNG